MINIHAAKDYLLDRAKESSTWRGIVLLITATGAHLNPDQRELIISGGIGLAGLLGAVTKDPVK